MATILLAGGTGLIGSHLRTNLLQAGHTVRVLTRSAKRAKQADYFYWNPQNNEVDTAAFAGVTAIINLCGAGIAAKRWSTNYKQVIINSRTESTALLYRTCQQTHCNLQVYISASGISYYGENGSNTMYEEDQPSGNNFLTQVCTQWEHSALQMQDVAQRTVLLRTGIVLSTQDGMLVKLQATIKFGFVTIFGKGSQYYSWIHIQDIARMYEFALNTTQVSGAYNAVAPTPVTNRELVTALRRNYVKTLRVLPVPKIALQLILGEMHSLLILSTKASSNKIEQAGFTFKFPTLNKALQQLYRHSN